MSLNNKKIFVTGAAGFIGSNLIHMLLNTYPDIHLLSYDALTYAGDLNNLNDIIADQRHQFVHGNIGDASLLIKILDEFQPSAIIHLAAETHVDRSIDASAPFVESNVLAHCILLETVQSWWQNSGQNKDFRFVHISTDEVFGSLNEGDKAFDENTPYNPRSPYAASKAAADHFSCAWHNTYGLPIIIVNCSNNYGPRQHPEKLIPLVITNALKGQDITIYGDGKNIRDWLYVDDHCHAIAAVLDRGKIGERYCIGGYYELTNIDLVHMICEIMDQEKPRADGASYKKHITFIKDRPGHDRRYAVNSSKAQENLGWNTKMDFDTGLRQTIRWYINNQ